MKNAYEYSEKIIELCKFRAYGSFDATNEEEGDFGTWLAWQRVIQDAFIAGAQTKQV